MTLFLPVPFVFSASLGFASALLSPLSLSWLSRGCFMRRIVVLFVCGLLCFPAVAQESSVSNQLSQIEYRLDQLTTVVQALRIFLQQNINGLASSAQQRNIVLNQIRDLLADLDIDVSGSVATNDFASLTNRLESIYLNLGGITNQLNDISDYVVEQNELVYEIRDYVSELMIALEYLYQIEQNGIEIRGDLDNLWQELESFHADLESLYDLGEGQWGTMLDIYEVLDSGNISGLGSRLGDILRAIEDLRIEIHGWGCDCASVLTNAVLSVDLTPILPVLHSIREYNQNSALYLFDIYSSLIQLQYKTDTIINFLEGFESHFKTIEAIFNLWNEKFVRWDKLFTDYYNSSFDSAGWSDMRKFFVDYYNESSGLPSTESALTNISYTVWRELNWFQKVDVALWKLVAFFYGSSDESDFDADSTESVEDSLQSKSDELKDVLVGRQTDFLDNYNSMVDQFRGFNESLDMIASMGDGSKVIHFWSPMSLAGLNVPAFDLDMESSSLYTGSRSLVRPLCLVAWSLIGGVFLITVWGYELCFLISLLWWLWMCFSDMKLHRFKFYGFLSWGAGESGTDVL